MDGKINNILLETYDFLETLNMQIFKYDHVITWFQKLCKNLTSLVILITEQCRKDYFKLDKDTQDALLLHLSQLVTSLSLLINIFARESDVKQILTEARTCAKKQLFWCLEGIQEILKEKAIFEPPGNFIKWMDSALDKLGEIVVGSKNIKEAYEDTKIVIEEVLSHAMSIGQVALEEDCKIIRGSSQTVLNSLDALTKELNKVTPHSPMVKLFSDSCSDKLCALEKRVNTAVLRMCLKVFSRYSTKLKEIRDFCFEVKNKEKLNDLDTLVADFDLHVDRIMQVGLFAVSCSTCPNKVIKIRGCLASLENLESELVPAYTSVLLDSSTQKVNLAFLLENHWLQQANLLRHLIYLIIDPFAFCQVIFEENKQIVDDLSDAMKDSRKSFMNNKKILLGLLYNSDVLKKFIDTITIEKPDDVTENTKKNFTDFKNVMHEVRFAADALLLEQNISNHARVLKRCKILLVTIKRLWISFADENDLNTNENKNKIPSADMTKTSIENGDFTTCKNTGIVFLDRIISRGSQILNNRSILYKQNHLVDVSNDTYNIQASTMKKLNDLRGTSKSAPLSKMIHLRKLSFAHNQSRKKNGSFSKIQMTDILEELNNMTSTFSVC